MTEERVIKSKPKSKIKIGDKFERWTVLENLGMTKRHTYYKCRCKCGNIRTVQGGNLRSGHSTSCGCLKEERAITHGMTKTSAYRTWADMIQRCTNSKQPTYKNYGERGITVCQEWKDSFEVFFKDMGQKPKGLTLERKDNDLGSFKENCKWATRIEQSRNCRVRKINKTGIKGVYLRKDSRKYQVRITVNYQNHYIGLFAHLEDAKLARQEAEQKYWS